MEGQSMKLIITPLLGATTLTFMLLAGCATPARVERMQVDPSLAQRTAAAKSPFKDSIAIMAVTGGKETNPAWISNVSSDDFERALQASLRDAGLLATDRQGSAYTLVANLQKLEQPLVGLDMTVTATVQYTLVERSSGREVYAKTLTTPYTATFSDAFAGVERLKLANEGAMRASISRLIADLTELKVTALTLP
jgi:hypothetical protein